MSIRLIASDMDGTLLNPYGEITAANIAAISEAQKQGVEFLICSGRDYHDAKTIVEAAGIICGYICLSGAVICDAEGNRKADIPLTAEEVHTAEGILTRHGASMDILTDRGRYCTTPPEEKFLNICLFCNGFSPLPSPIPEEIAGNARKRMADVRFVRNISEIPAGVKIYKICGNDLEEDLVIRMKQEFAAFNNLAAASSFPTNIEVTAEKAQKGHALKTYAALKGIAPDEIMVLGDSDNDLSMFLPEFGLTVAMDNSMPCIRDAANRRTKSNAEDGVAWAIQNYVLK